METKIRIPLDRAMGQDAAKRVQELAMYLSPAIQSAVFADGALVLYVNENANFELDAVVADTRDLLATSQEMDRIESRKILRTSDGRLTYNQDPWPDLLSSGQVQEIDKGICTLCGPAAILLSDIDKYFLDLAATLGAVPHVYGTFLPASAATASGYLSNFAHHAMFVAVAHRSLRSVRALASCESLDDAANLQEHLQTSFWLAPTVCYHTFHHLQNQSTQAGSVFTACNPCHRFEAFGAGSLSRLHVFHMREIVFFGDGAGVIATRDQLLRACEDFLSSMGLTYRVRLASDPFFMDNVRQKAYFQILSESKLELQAYIPHSEEWLAVMSFNNHRSSLTNRFNVGDESLQSGCFGVGLERMIYAIAAQHGPALADVSI